MSQGNMLFGSRFFSWGILAGITFLLVADCYFCTPIFNDKEGIYCGSVREMMQRGDWLVPTTGGFPRIQKPPLLYWSMLVSCSVFGLNEFALRLPNALAVAGWFITIYLIMRRVINEQFALATVLILSTCLGVCVFTRNVQPEPLFTLFLSLSIWSLVQARFAREQTIVKTEGWYLLVWVFMALGCLTKGLHGVAWPLGAALLTTCFFPSTRSWLRPIFSWKGFLLFVLILAPWYIYMSWHFPAFLINHFGNEQVAASVGLRYPYRVMASYKLFYPMQLVGLLPWVLAFPAVIYRVLTWQEKLSAPSLDAICFMGILLPLQVISLVFSSHLPYYGITYWGLAAAVLALGWYEPVGAKQPMRRWYLLPACVALVFLGLFYLCLGYKRSTGWKMAEPADIFAYDGWTSNFLIAPAIGLDSIPLILGLGLIILIGATVAAWFCWQRRSYSALLTLSATLLAPYLFYTINTFALTPYLSLYDVSQFLNREIASKPEALVYWNGPTIQDSSFFYYLNTSPRWVGIPNDDQYAQRVLGLGKDYFLDEKAFLEVWRSSRPVYLVIFKSREDHWKSLISTDHVLYESGQRLVFCNQ